MPLTLLPLPASHIPALVDLTNAAFTAASDVNMRLIFPHGHTTAIRAYNIDRNTDTYHNVRNSVFLGVYDIPSSHADPATDSAEKLPSDWLICGARLRLEDPPNSR